MSELAKWDSFYIIVGSAAAALIGLQFVALTLIAERPPVRAAEAGAAFATPTIVHFGAVLLVSAVLSVPWQTISHATVLWGLMGVGGIVYSLITARRMQTQGAYSPVLEDWVFHLVLPLLAHSLLVVSAIYAFSEMREALFGVGAAALLFLFVGIHNAWDGVTYTLLIRKPTTNNDSQGESASKGESDAGNA